MSRIECRDTNSNCPHLNTMDNNGQLNSAEDSCSSLLFRNFVSLPMLIGFDVCERITNKGIADCREFCQSGVFDYSRVQGLCSSPAASLDWLVHLWRVLKRPQSRRALKQSSSRCRCKTRGSVPKAQRIALIFPLIR